MEFVFSVSLDVLYILVLSRGCKCDKGAYSIPKDGRTGDNVDTDKCNDSKDDRRYQ